MSERPRVARVRGAVAGFALLALASATLACGTSDPPPEGLAAELPSVVLSADEVAALFTSPSFDPEVVQEAADFRSNKQVAKEPSSILEFTDDIDEIREAGRVYGYVASYRLSQASGVYLVIELYEDAGLAQAALERPPLHSAGAPLDVAQVGDATVAWPGIVWGENHVPACPCELQFRVDRFVAAVKGVRSAGPAPSPLEDPDPRHIAIARIVAERMRALADGPSDNGS